MKTRTRKFFRKALVPLFVFIFAITNMILIADNDNEFVIGEKVSLHSAILNEDRNLLVYLPSGYEMTDKSYPVMYLLDGDVHFHHVTGIVGFLSAQGLIPEMIVVAIVNVDRNRDFSPTHITEIPTSGGAGNFLYFISDELTPFIEKNYRTVGYNILVGHSFGGAFAIYALLEEPELFNAFIAVSPYLMYDNNFLVNDMKAKLKSSYKNVEFYMTIGNEPTYFDALDQFTKNVNLRQAEGLEFSYIQMKDESHMSIPHLSIYNGLKYIYSGWQLPKEIFTAGLESVDTYYKSLSDKYGYKVEVPESTINLLGYYYLQQKKDKEKALEVFKENVKRFPLSANVYDSLGEAYEKSGQNKKAENNYQKAVELAEKENQPFLKIYKENLLRVQQVTAKNKG